MGYTFKIGNAVPEFSKEDGELYARWVVENTSREDAPTFPNDAAGNGNSRSPSYTVWADFCRDTGLYDLFYGRDGNLRAGHPGCEMLTQYHLECVREALKVWQRTATQPPGFSGYPEFDTETQTWTCRDEDKYDGVSARLIWLEWWMAWALDNCETPAIQNT